MAGFTAKSIDELRTTSNGFTRLAGADLGVESFGMQVFDFPPDFQDYPEHDHGDEGQEEVYIVLRGSMNVEVGGERVSLSVGDMVRVAPATRRKLLPGPDGVRVLALGSVIDGEYERPEGLR